MDVPGGIVTVGQVEQFLACQAQANRGFWRNDATAPGAETALARDVIRRLVSMDLVRHLTDGVVVMPAIHRYRHELRTALVSPASLES